MSVILIEAIIAKVSGIPEDAAVNTFTFEGDGLSASDLWEIAWPAVDNFYNVGAMGADTQVALALSPSVDDSPNAATLKGYDITGSLAGGSHGSPFATRGMQLLTDGGGGLVFPAECAIVMSFHGDLTNVPVEVGNTRPASRRHGRIFLGPLNGGNGTPNAGMEEMVGPTIISHINASAEALRLEVLTSSSDDASWAVWSRVDADTYRVVGGWVDNAYDTQRRRGNEATTRSTWSA